MKLIKLIIVVIAFIFLVSCVDNNISNNISDGESSVDGYFNITPYLRISFSDLIQAEIEPFNHLPDAGSSEGWVKWDYIYHDTNWSSSDGIIVENDGGRGGIYYERQFYDFMLKDYIFKVDMKMPEDLNDSQAAMGIALRSSFTLSQHRLKLLWKESVIFLYYEDSSSQYNLIATADDEPWDDGWNTIEAKVEGEIFNLKIDGKDITMKEKESGKEKNDIKIPLSVGQFGPYAENAPGVMFQNIEFKILDDIEIEGPEIKIPYNNDESEWMTDRTYKEIMNGHLKDFISPFISDIDLIYSHSDIDLFYFSRSDNLSLKINESDDGEEKILIQE